MIIKINIIALFYPKGIPDFEKYIQENYTSTTCLPGNDPNQLSGSCPINVQTPGMSAVPASCRLLFKNTSVNFFGMRLYRI